MGCTDLGNQIILLHLTGCLDLFIRLIDRIIMICYVIMILKFILLPPLHHLSPTHLLFEINYCFN